MRVERAIGNSAAAIEDNEILRIRRLNHALSPADDARKSTSQCRLPFGESVLLFAHQYGFTCSFELEPDIVEGEKVTFEDCD